MTDTMGVLRGMGLGLILLVLAFAKPQPLAWAAGSTSVCEIKKPRAFTDYTTERMSVVVDLYPLRCGESVVLGGSARMTHDSGIEQQQARRAFSCARVVTSCKVRFKLDHLVVEDADYRLRVKIRVHGEKIPFRWDWSCQASLTNASCDH
jgi:hypothetical protein